MKRIFYLALLAIAVCFFLVACPNPKLPTVTKVSGPEGAINQASSTFTFSGSSPGGTIVKYEYRKDGGSWTDHGMNTSYTWNGYSEGPHTFEVRVKDSKDAYSSIISWSFTYKSDNLPPIVEKVSGPSGEIDQDSGTFTWSGNDPDGSIVKYEYRKDGGSWFNHGLNTSYTWSGYSEGAHTFEVRAQDNKGAYSNEVKWNFSYKLVMCTVVDFEVESWLIHREEFTSVRCTGAESQLIQRLPLTREVSKSLRALWKERDCL